MRPNNPDFARALSGRDSGANSQSKKPDTQPTIIVDRVAKSLNVIEIYYKSGIL